MSLLPARTPVGWVMGRRSVLWLAAWLIVAQQVGCADESPSFANQKPVHPVRGRVTVGGQPAAGAFVLLVPVDEPPDAKDPRPRAEVQEDGSFTIWTYAPDDGAPAGEYVVTVRWEDRDVGDKLGGRFAEATSSPLRASVKEGSNELPPFAL
jgi:hypothetical protein